MSVTRTYPGVYIEEIPSGVRTITGVATSITAFVGRALWGPVDEPTRIQSFAEYQRAFGGLWAESAMSYAVRHYFQNGGVDALIVRIVDDVGAKATVELGAGGETLTLEAVEAGESGNSLSVTVTNVSGDPGKFDLTIKRVDAGSPVDLESFSGLIVGDLKSKLESDSEFVRVKDPSPDSRPDAAADQPMTGGGADAAENATIALDATSDPNKLVLEAASPGAWGGNLQAIVDHKTSKPTDETLFNLIVQLTEGTEIVAEELIRNISVSDGSRRPVTDVLKEESDFVRVVETAGLPEKRPDSNDTDSEEKIIPTPAQGGADGLVPGEAFYIGSELDKTGIHALRKADIFNLLCIPPSTRLPDDETGEAVWTEAHIFCKEHRAMLIIDPPSSWRDTTGAEEGMDDIRGQLGGEQATHAAVYFPRVKMPDPLKENRTEEFVPCGAVAGVIARTDAQRGVWKAPAGSAASLTGVRELAYSLTDGENGRLNPLGVNCLRSFPVFGHVVWGARTLAGANRLTSEWKYVPVRRLALFIEESLYRGTQWVVFEPNDEPLWAQIRLNVGAFMQNLFRQGAFQGTTPREAYFVKCDKETTTQNDINQGIVNIVVGFSALKPAEFVIVQIQQMAGQIEA